MSPTDVQPQLSGTSIPRRRGLSRTNRYCRVRRLLPNPSGHPANDLYSQERRRIITGIPESFRRQGEYAVASMFSTLAIIKAPKQHPAERVARPKSRSRTLTTPPTHAFQNRPHQAGAEISRRSAGPPRPSRSCHRCREGGRHALMPEPTSTHERKRPLLASDGHTNARRGCSSRVLSVPCARSRWEPINFPPQDPGAA